MSSFFRRPWRKTSTAAKLATSNSTSNVDANNDKKQEESKPNEFISIERSLLRAIEKSDFNWISRILNDGKKKKESTWALMLAIGNKHLGAVEYLLYELETPVQADPQKGMKNIANRYGVTGSPLCYASSCGLVDIVNALLDAGASVDARDSEGRTPLMLAVIGSSTSPPAPDDDEEYDEVCNILGDVRCGHFELYFRTFQSLLDAGSDATATDRHGLNILMHACRLPRTMPFVEYITTRDRHFDIDLEARCTKGYTAMVYWARFRSFNSSSYFHALVAAGADVNSVDENGCTALRELVRHLNAPRVVELLENGADANMSGPDGNTALHFAFQHWVPLSRDITVALLAHGAKAFLKNAEGKVAADMARDKSKIPADVIEMLAQAKANHGKRIKAAKR